MLIDSEINLICKVAKLCGLDEVELIKKARANDKIVNLRLEAIEQMRKERKQKKTHFVVTLEYLGATTKEGPEKYIESSLYFNSYDEAESFYDEKVEANIRLYRTCPLYNPYTCITFTSFNEIIKRFDEIDLMKCAKGEF